MTTTEAREADRLIARLAADDVDMLTYTVGVKRLAVLLGVSRDAAAVRVRDAFDARRGAA